MGQAHTDLFVPQHNPYFLEPPLNSFEATKRTHATPKQPARANASGLCVGGCVCSRTLELPQNADIGAPRSPQGNGANGLQCDNFVALCGVSLWRSKTKNFLSISFSASRWRGGGRRREKNARKFFGFCARESASVSEAHWFVSPRNRSV